MSYYDAAGRPIIITEPGIFFDMPADVYHAQPAVSCSGLKKLMQSPFHYWYDHINPSRLPVELNTASMILGRKRHKWLLEPETFFDTYIKKEGVKSSQATDKATGKEYVGEGELKEIQESVRVLKLVMPKVFDICIAGAKTEVSMFWHDPRTGILCRCRHDLFKPGISTDYKTAQQVSRRDTIGTALGYDYPIQDVHYTRGMKATTGKDSHFCFLFQEGTAPFAPYALTFKDEVVKKAGEMIDAALDVYQFYTEANTKNGVFDPCIPWPAFGDTVEDIGKDELDFFNKGWWLNREF